MHEVEPSSRYLLTHFRVDTGSSGVKSLIVLKSISVERRADIDFVSFD